MPLENTASRPERWTLVDLAVVRQGIPLVQRCFACVSLPLDDLSLVIIDEDSTDHERQNWLRAFWVYSKYLRKNAQALQSKNTSKLVLAWYEMRLNEMSRVMMQNRKMGV